MKREEDQAEYVHTAHKLIRGSEKRKFDVFNRVNYQERLNHDRWQFPETLVSLYYHPIYSELSDETKWNLALQEGLQFFSFNIHGEQALVAEMEPRLYRNKRAGEDPVSSEYLQRFIHEENAHTFMLAGYCNRYSDGVNRSRNVVVQNLKLSPEGQDVLFYGRILTLEIYLGHVNKIAFDFPNLDRTAQDIHRFHHSDEMRHKAWDKAMLLENVNRLRAVKAYEELSKIRVLLDSYRAYVCSASLDPKPYRVVGLTDLVRLRSEVSVLPQRCEIEKQWTTQVVDYFSKIGLQS